MEDPANPKEDDSQKAVTKGRLVRIVIVVAVVATGHEIERLTQRTFGTNGKLQLATKTTTINHHGSIDKSCDGTRFSLRDEARIQRESVCCDTGVGGSRGS